SPDSGSATRTWCPRAASARARPQTRSPSPVAIPSDVKIGTLENSRTLAIKHSPPTVSTPFLLLLLLLLLLEASRVRVGVGVGKAVPPAGATPMPTAATVSGTGAEFAALALCEDLTGHPILSAGAWRGAGAAGGVCRVHGGGGPRGDGADGLPELPDAAP